jgi:predicted phosphodiesterase
MFYLFRKIRQYRNSFRQIGCILILLTGCSDLIEYSPFETEISEHNYNQRNINKIDSTIADTLRFAFISDSHNYIDDLKDAIKRINADTTIKFILVGGDVTSYGLQKEYEWYFKAIKKAKVPVITVIGNHDYLSNGHKIFKKMFGPTNCYFFTGQYKFILFDDVVWENNNKIPDFGWLLEQLSDTLHKNILVTHIPPWSDQMVRLEKDFIQAITVNRPLIILMGHTHAYSEGEFEGTHYTVTGTIEDRTFLKISLINEKSIIQKIDY